MDTKTAEVATDEVEVPPELKGKLPADIPGHAALDAAGIHTYSQLRKAVAKGTPETPWYTDVAGIADKTAEKIAEVLAATPAEEEEPVEEAAEEAAPEVAAKVSPLTAPTVHLPGEEPVRPVVAPTVHIPGEEPKPQGAPAPPVYPEEAQNP